MLGRNEVCSCGSGKKYKKCCMNKDMITEIVDRKVSTAKKQYADLYNKMYEYSRQDRFKEELELAKKEFCIVNDEEINAKFKRWFNTYYIQGHILKEKKVLTSLYYEENSNDIETNEFNVIKGLFESYLSVYKVIEKKDETVVLEDCITNQIVNIDDVKFLENFAIGEYMITRMVSILDTNILVDVTVKISEEIKNVIVKDINMLFNNHRDIYDTVSNFLVYNTHIVYKYMQQLLEPKIGQLILSKKDENQGQEVKANEEVAITSVEETEVENTCEVSKLLTSTIESEYLQNALDFWTEYKNNHEIKGSENGWAAAVEYHIKKINGSEETQTTISKKYATSSSTLGKRYKDLKA